MPPSQQLVRYFSLESNLLSVFSLERSQRPTQTQFMGKGRTVCDSIHDRKNLNS